jgi:S-adenosylmethionine hydrolase
MKPSGVITITTDFGHKGPFAAVMKGVIISRFHDAKIIDLAHDIPAQWPPEAGFWVSRSYSYFPQGTVHLAIVDPGVGTERDILLVEYDEHYFMAPDNGLLARLLDTAVDATVFKLNLEALERLDIPTYFCANRRRTRGRQNDTGCHWHSHRRVDTGMA